MARKPDTALRTRALRCLARRDYSRAELHARLLPHVQEGEDLDAELDALTALGWLSDARTADQLIARRRNRLGAQRITQELKQKGIGSDLISAVLPHLKETELEAAHAVWQKKFHSLPGNAQEKARQIRFLQSRGFDLETISKAMRMASDAGAEGD